MNEKEIARLRQENEYLKRRARKADALIDSLLERLHTSRFDAIYEKWCAGCMGEADCHKNLTLCEEVMGLMEDV